MSSRAFVLAALSALLFSFACKEQSGGLGDATPDTKSNVEKQRDKDKKDPKAEAPPDFEKALKMTPSFDKEKGELVVSMSLREGFHAYAPGNEIGVPVSMNVLPENGWKMKGEADVPKGKEKDLGELGVAKMLTGSFPVKASVEGGDGTIAGQMRVQICTEKVCDRPRTHGFKAAVPDA